MQPELSRARWGVEVSSGEHEPRHAPAEREAIVHIEWSVPATQVPSEAGCAPLDSACAWADLSHPPRHIDEARHPCDESRRMEPLPLVLLPGLDGTGWLLRDFVATLGPTVAPRVVAYPTHEVRTYAGLEPIVEASLPREGRPFAIVAESFGGPLALRVAAKRPPGLAAVVLVATFVRAPVPSWMRRLRGLLGATFFSVPPPAPLVRALMTGWGADDALVAAFRASVGAAHPAVLAARVRAVLEVDEAAAFVDCPVPVLYVRAEHDALLRKGIAGELQTLRPDLAIASLPAPHLVLQTHAREAAEIVRSFLREQGVSA